MIEHAAGVLTPQARTTLSACNAVDRRLVNALQALGVKAMEVSRRGGGLGGVRHYPLFLDSPFAKGVEEGREVMLTYPALCASLAAIGWPKPELCPGFFKDQVGGAGGAGASAASATFAPSPAGALAASAPSAFSPATLAEVSPAHKDVAASAASALSHATPAEVSPKPPPPAATPSHMPMVGGAGSAAKRPAGAAPEGAVESSPLSRRALELAVHKPLSLEAQLAELLGRLRHERETAGRVLTQADKKVRDAERVAANPPPNATAEFLEAAKDNLDGARRAQVDAQEAFNAAKAKYAEMED